MGSGAVAGIRDFLFGNMGNRSKVAGRDQALRVTIAAFVPILPVYYRDGDAPRPRKRNGRQVFFMNVSGIRLHEQHRNELTR